MSRFKSIRTWVHVTESKTASRKAKPASATTSTPRNDSDGVIEAGENEVMARIAKAKGETEIQKSGKETHTTRPEELKALEAQKEALSNEILAASSTSAAVSKIERPRGVSIQEGMGLSNNKPKYDAIRVCPCVHIATGL
jgi:hypothetical protein